MNKITGFLTLSSVAVLSVGLAACTSDADPTVAPTVQPATEPTEVAPTPTTQPTPTEIPATATPTTVPTVTPTLPAPTPVPPTQVPPTVTPEPTQIVYPIEYSFADNFSADSEDWTVGFADLPKDWTDDLYELDSEFRQLPEGLDGNGIWVQGHNRSDDLFMFLTKEITGLQPNTNYEVFISIDLATNIPAAMMGIGGSPGESVYVKAGASTEEPVVTVDDLDHLRISIDKGNQSSHGSEMFSIGNVAHFDVLIDEYRIKTLDNTGRTVIIPSDDDGRLWVTVGTDSGFEGLSTFYYSAIRYQLTATE